LIGRLLGIDHGQKRIGIAVSDALGISARELTIIPNTEDEAVFADIKRIANEQMAIALIVGHPTNIGGNTEQARKVAVWTEALREAISLPIQLWDEQLTSADALEIARELKRKPKDPIDDLAARVILQSYLNALEDGLAQPPGSPP
jgi:putative Holliday junction resolvase